MPNYEVECKKCKKRYEIFSSIAKMDENIKKAKCECGSKSKKKIFSGINFAFANPEGTSRWNASQDYRFKHKLPKARAEREAAQRASHMGSDPYNRIDDVSSGKHFGKVK